MITLLLLVGCEDVEAACAAAAVAGPTLTLGTGESAWEALEADQSVGWDYGTQGGMHVYGSLQATHLVQPASNNLADPATPLVDFVLLDGDVEIAGFRELPHHFTEGLDGSFQVLGDRLVLYEEDEGYLDGLAIVMRAQVTDRCGTPVQAELPLVLSASDD